MRAKSLGLALAVLLAPALASATSVTTVGNQTGILYDNTDSNVVLGNFNLMDDSVGVSSIITEDNVSGSLQFGVYTDPLAPGANGTIDVNISTGSGIFSGTFDGTALNFETLLGDFVASFSTTFSDTSDVALFTFDFAGFDSSDQFQVNVAAVPLPATLPLLLAALFGMGFLSRRRQQAEA